MVVGAISSNPKTDMLTKARRAVLESANWLTAADLRNAGVQPDTWKELGQVFTIHHDGVDYFPGYGLNPETGYRPLEALADVIKTFGERKSGWGMAYWFASVNSQLGGKRPQDLLATEPERVLAAARDEIQEIDHA